MIPRAISFAYKVYNNRSLIWMLTKRALQNRYAGTFAGLLWALIQPLTSILVYWFVFSVGFKVKPLGDVPFVVVFLCGFIPWVLFSETLNSNVNAITFSGFLVKRTVFPTEILPVVNLMTGFVAHFLMILILMLILVLNHLPISLSLIWFLLPFLGLMMWCLGLGWLIAALNVFYRDIGSGIGIILNVWFWMTPIAWGSEMIPPAWQWVIKLNPLYYIVEGYKQAFIYSSQAHSFHQEVYFWLISFLILAGGALVFRKLKAEFPDVL